MSDALVVLAPLRIEALALGHHDGVRVLRTGMGPVRSRAAAQRARALDSPALAIAGLCAGIAPALRAGDVVCASELRCEDADPLALPASTLLAAELRRRGLRVHVGALASSTQIEGPAARRLRQGEALALDMESAWLAQAAGGRPLAVVRVVVDIAGRRLADPRIALAGLAALRSLHRSGGALAAWAYALKGEPSAVSPTPANAAGRTAADDPLRFDSPRELTPG